MAKKKTAKKKEKKAPTPTDLVHCTHCGLMHRDVEKCPSCGDVTSQRPLKFTGVPIYMTYATEVQQ